MFDLLFIGLLFIFSVILGIEGIRKWRESRQTGFLIGGVISIFAGLIFITTLSSGFGMLALAIIIRVVTGFVSRRAESSHIEGSSETEESEAR
jgi:uncharacterized membrane protein HdeD (DUF308 family)